MNLISVFAILVVSFLIIGFIAAISNNRKDHEEEETDHPHVVISQEVPSLFDTFKERWKK